MKEPDLPYALEPETGVHLRRGFAGIAYSDGAEFERRLLGVLRAASDLSTGSEELARAITDWPSEAHLSPARANVLRPFQIGSGDLVLELGAGCGALTRYIGETGATVHAVEGAQARAACAGARVRDLANVTVYCDDLARFETSQRYDVVTLVGVLEYAPLFIGGDDPVDECLRRARSLLKPTGVLLVAIENQLGLKYLNGCHEDHVGARFAGVTGLYGPNTAITFGRQELEARLRRAGLAHADWYLPFPDYKTPTIVVAERATRVDGFNVADLLLGESARDHAGSPLRAFDEAGAWPVVARNGLLGNLANSFVVLARAGEANRLDRDAGWLAHKYGTSRRKRFATDTAFVASDDGIWVEKKPLYPPDMEPAEWDGVAVRQRLERTKYIEGTLFARDIVDAIGRSDALGDVAAAFTPWIGFLLEHACSETDARPWSRRKLPGDLLDCVPFNLIRDRAGRLQTIDLEFAVEGTVPLPWVVLRGIVHTAGKCFGHRALLDLSCDALFRAVVERIGLGDIEDWTPFCDLEDRLVVQVLLPWPGRPDRGLLLERLRSPATAAVSAFERLSRVERQHLVGQHQLQSFMAWLRDLPTRASGAAPEVSDPEQSLAWQARAIAVSLANTWPSLSNAAARQALLAVVQMVELAQQSQRATETKERLLDDLAQRGRRCAYLEQALADSNKALAKYLADSARMQASLDTALQDIQAHHQRELDLRERLADVSTQMEQRERDWQDQAARLHAEFEQARSEHVLATRAHEAHVAQLERAVTATQNEASVTAETLRRQLSSAQHATEAAEARAAELLAHLGQIEASRWFRIGHWFGRVRRVGDTGSEGLGERTLFALTRTFYRHLPVPKEMRIGAKNAFYRRFGSVFRHTQNYQIWRAQYATANSDRAGAVERGTFVLLRSVYRKLPFPRDTRVRAKDAFYGRFGTLFGRTRNYQVWREEQGGEAHTPSAGPAARADVEGTSETAPPASLSAYLVSIIVPAFGKAAMTRECVEHACAAQGRAAFEVIVVDDASPEPLAAALPADARVRVVRNEQNTGFVGACNRGAAEARGTHLMFLNNDAELRPGAIDALLRTFEEHASVGIVGPRIVFPDGRLQEAGAYVRPDGSAVMIGLWDNPARPMYGFARQVGYVSGACLLIERTLFDQLGGFDSTFAPAYCEDSDLCYRTRARGRKVMYQPHATVVHALSASMESASIDKQAIVATNRDKFLARWGETLKRDDTIRTIAFYLPQYHPIPENDRWWGKGFTEWANVARAKPAFPGHHQPNIPADLGFYDLRLPEVREQQARLARNAGIHAFCYYHYWFGGTRLLNAPFDAMLASGAPDFPFCVCWANENWTRRWDGLESEILIAQRHSPEDDMAFIDALLPAFRDPRYVRVDGKPLLMLYRPSLLPDARATATRWREHAQRNGIVDLYLVAVQSFYHLDTTGPDAFGFDGAVEFPPHSLAVQCKDQPRGFAERRFEGMAYDYVATAESFLTREPPAYKLFRSVMPRWDNTARRGNKANVFLNATPEAYRHWLQAAADYTRKMYFGDERLLFINAWNEWGEGNYLEPDQRYGSAYLEATATVLRASTPADTPREIAA